MASWRYNPDESSYSADFPVAEGRSATITVFGDDFANEEFAKGRGEFLPLKEGCFYHYELKPKGARLAQGSSFVDPAKPSRTMAPGTAVGFGRLWLDGHTRLDESLGVEVVSNVIGYKDDYEKLLSQLTGYIADLQMQVASDVQYAVGVDCEKESENEIQQMFFLIGLVNDPVFEQALRRIEENPYRKLRTLEMEFDTRHAMRLNAAALRQFASATRRVAAPGSLARRGIPSIPERIRGVKRIESSDVTENRFVKHVLSTFRGRLRNFRERIDSGKPKCGGARFYAIELDADAALERLDRWLASEFFHGIGELTAAPSSSIVLQRREGYRDILRKWLQSQAAAKISWAAGEEAFCENQKDVATLYEYWCFFRLLDIAKDAFSIPEESIAKELVVDKGTDGLSLKINEGAQLPPLNGTFVSGHTSQRYRKLDIEFHYNRHFTNSAKGGKSSWTMTMIPDYTISFRPQGMDVELAEKLDLITYVHFDAKYKAKEIVEEMSAAEQDADTATTEEVKLRKDVKRVDILKMHTYRDAIPRTAGAYILYPGTKDNSRRYEYGDEILPSLGAFPLYPRDDKSDEEPIGRFLTSVAEYLCDRITRWENFTYQKNLVFSGSQEEWGKKQAEVAHHVKTMGFAEDWQGGGRVNLTEREQLAMIPVDHFHYANIGGSKATQSRWHQAKWISENLRFVQSKGQKINCKIEELVMIIAMWHPPFTMMVRRYCGTMTREQLEANGQPLPFGGSEFHVWDIALHGFEHVADYLARNPNGPAPSEEKTN